MKKLLIVHSINPYKGSEDYIGWNWLLLLSKNTNDNDEIYVITKSFNEKDLRDGIKKNHINNINLIIIDVPKYLDWFREKYSIFHHLYYIWWQKFVYRWIKKSKMKFDIIHHATMNDYRIYSLIYKVKNSYTILGPVGGAQITPRALEKYETEKMRYRFRKFINKTCSVNYFYKRAMKKYSVIYTINNETKSQIEKISKRKCTLLPELALNESLNNIIIEKKHHSKIKLLFVGRLIGKKGIYFLFDVIKELHKKNDNFELDVYGEGKEFDNFRKMIIENNLNNIIHLMGAKNFNEISNAYKNADIFVMPSLRETSGNVFLEAMSHALPLVCFDMSFASQLKEINCGIFIDVKQSKEKIVMDFGSAIIKLSNDKKLRETYGRNAYKYVNSHFSWDEKYKKIYVDDYAKYKNNSRR